MSLINVDFPLPETPVIQVKSPTGNFKFTPFKLFPSALIISRKPLLGSCRLVGIKIFFSPERYCPVSESLSFEIFLGVPEHTILPPWIPAPGPISMTKSALRMANSSSCARPPWPHVQR